MAVRTAWEGHYLDGRTPARQRVSVQLSRQGLALSGARGLSSFWPYAAVRLTQGHYTGEQVRLERGEGPAAEVLLLDDAAVLDSLHALAPGLAGRLASPKRERTRIGLALLAAIGVVGFVAALYLWGIPAAAYLVAPRVPPAWEARLGEAVLAHLAPAGRRCVVPAVEEAMREMAARLTDPGEPPPFPLRITVVRDRRVNAFAVPGGHIVILGGLLQGTSSPEEAAAVLAHEVQHLVRRHAMRGLLEQASTGLLVAALTGDASGLLAFGLEGARTLAVLRYSRRNEEEADLEGLRMLVRAGVDPQGMVTFLERLRTSERGARVPAYLSTHPDTVARIAAVRAEAAQHRVPPMVLAAAPDWRAVSQACAPPPGRRMPPGQEGS